MVESDKWILFSEENGEQNPVAENAGKKEKTRFDTVRNVNLLRDTKMPGVCLGRGGLISRNLEIRSEEGERYRSYGIRIRYILRSTYICYVCVNVKCCFSK